MYHMPLVELPRFVKISNIHCAGLTLKIRSMSTKSNHFFGCQRDPYQNQHRRGRGGGGGVANRI